MVITRGRLEVRIPVVVLQLDEFLFRPDKWQGLFRISPRGVNNRPYASPLFEVPIRALHGLG